MSLGRVQQALGKTTQAVAVAYLTQGLQITDQLGRREDEAAGGDIHLQVNSR